jgi:hypothetical protein
MDKKKELVDAVLKSADTRLNLLKSAASATRTT